MPCCETLYMAKPVLAALQSVCNMCTGSRCLITGTRAAFAGITHGSDGCHICRRRRSVNWLCGTCCCTPTPPPSWSLVH
jgi:hypothetical protein